MMNKVYIVMFLGILSLIGVYCFASEYNSIDHMTANADSFNRRFERFEKLIGESVPYKVMEYDLIEPALTNNIDFILDKLEERDRAIYEGLERIKKLSR